MYGWKPVGCLLIIVAWLWVLEQRIDSIGAANRWGDGTGASWMQRGGGSAVIPVPLSWALLVSGPSPRRC